MEKEIETLHFRLQPIVKIPTGQTVGFEVLSTLSVDGPIEEYFSKASNSFLLNVIRAQLSLRLDDELSIFMNIPAKIFRDDQVCSQIREHIAFNKLNFELQDPENLLDADKASLRSITKNIALFEQCGARVWLDDVKENMLSLVARMNIYGVKIDKSVFWKYRDSNESMFASFVGALRLFTDQVLVEGVERKTDLDIARRVGLDYGQGFYWPEISLKKQGDFLNVPY